MRRLGVILIFYLIADSTHAQESPAKHGMSLELGGPGGFGALYYEHFFGHTEGHFMSFRIGPGFAPKELDFSQGAVLGIPHGATINFGRRSNFFETGMLGNLLFNEEVDYFLGPTIGFRRQTSKWFFRFFIGGYMTIEQYPTFVRNLGLGVGLPLRTKDP